MVWSYQTCESQLLTLHSRAQELQLQSLLTTTTEDCVLEPMLCNKRNHAPQLQSSPFATTREKPIQQQRTSTGKYKSVSSVAQSCPTLCDPMNRSMPGLPVHHYLLEFTRVRDAIQPSHPRLSPSPPAPNPSQHQSLFQ